jgi:arylsulfatase A-like enzyme
VGATDRYSAELVSDEALRWLASSDEAPFFLLLTYSEPHTPIAAPERWLRHYDAFLTDEARDNPLLYYFDWRNRPWRGRGEYYATVSYLDEQLGRVIDYLRRQNRLNETLVIFSSDNGPVTAAALMPWELNMAGETAGLRGKKRFLFEGGIRVPGIVRYPEKLAAGTVETTPVTALDIFPTLAAFIGATTDPDVPLDGQSLWPLLGPDAAPAWGRGKPLFWAIETPDGLEFALRDGDWKLLLDGDGSPRYLFNLAEDYYEVYNRLADEPGVVDRLKRRFRAYRRELAQDPLALAR